MLVGKHSHEAAATCKATTDRIKSGILLVKGKVGGDGDNNNKIHWKDTGGVPCTLGGQQSSLKRLIVGGGSGVKMNDGTLVFPVEGTKREGAGKDEKTVSLILYLKDTKNWTLSKGMSADGCSVPSVVEWKGKLMMMTACDGGRRRVYESGDKGNSWTEALGTLSRVWGSKQQGNVKAVGSGFSTATIDGVEDNRNVMLVTLPVYPKEKEKCELHLWLTDNTHIVDIGPVSGDDDAAASALLYKSAEGESGDGNKEEKLIALYEKKKGDGEKPSPGMLSVRLTEQLQRVKVVLTTWKKVDDLVSKLCTSSSTAKDASPENACATDKITDGLVGFLSGNFSDTTWKDEYLGVNATVKKEDGAEKTDNGVTFKGRGAGAQWPVGEQGENQLYHFANYNFTLVATVSIHKVPEGDTPIPLMGAKINDGNNNPVLLGLSYNKKKKWILLCDGGNTRDLSSTWEPQTQYQVAIVLQNGKQGSVYVDGKPLEGMPFDLKNKGSKVISHFYIGGDGDSAEGQEGLSVTVRNVLLYNRPLSSEEIAALAKNTITIPKREGPKTLVVDARSPTVSAQDVERTVTQSNSPGQLPLEEEPLTANIGAGGDVSSAASVTTTPSSDDGPTVVTVGGDKMRGNGSPQTPEVGVSSGEDGETLEVTDAQGEEGIHPPAGEVNATALNGSLGNVSQGNNSDAGTVRGSGLLPSLLLLLLLGLWGFAAL
ncbi:trans-sialidase [Trypanosoma cruzi Dm28c]|uniref:Trans-sialidase n=1 Tax=Trypanosoma cruzi Dm28c TaxID=1416333 RepID=V5BF85_TRYCR|nr:trans-sialidase [Trypanosoma cruzi Dm28c]